LLGDASASEQIEGLVLGTDGSYLYLQVRLCRADGCLGGIVRLSRDGTPDDTFGNRGLTILGYTSGNHGGFQSLSLFAAQATGAPLFRGVNHSSSLDPYYDVSDYAVYRLLVDATPSPGFLTVVNSVTNANFDEPTRTTSITVARLAGMDGPLSVDYGTQDGYDIGEAEGRYDYYGARAGSDYEMASGPLDWADGDDGQRTVTISIIDDDLFEANDWFKFVISDPTGSSLIWGSTAVVLIIDDENPHTPLSPGPPAAPNGSGGGGGSLSWGSLLAVSGLLLWRLRHRQISRAQNLR
jgi:hypothetical protein